MGMAAWVTLFAPPSLQATEQIPDDIRIGETVAPLCMAPILAPYFAQHPDRDLQKGLGEELGEEYEPCNPDPDENLSSLSTNLWRGYVASFAIADGVLVVEEVWTSQFGWGDEWTPVIECAMPETEARRLDWFSGPLYYMRVDPKGDEEEREEYSLFQVDIEQGRYVGTKKLRSEIHGPNSGISCSAGWDEEPAEGPITFGWCLVDSIDASCSEQSPD